MNEAELDHRQSTVPLPGVSHNQLQMSLLSTVLPLNIPSDVVTVA